jgi:hypothetical protein
MVEMMPMTGMSTAASAARGMPASAAAAPAVRCGIERDRR